jgi:hypothetical protein
VKNVSLNLPKVKAPILGIKKEAVAIGRPTPPWILTVPNEATVVMELVHLTIILFRHGSFPFQKMDFFLFVFLSSLIIFNSLFFS